MTTFSCINCDTITNRSMEALKNLDLQDFSLLGCYNVGSDSIAGLFTKCKRLRRVALSEVLLIDKPLNSLGEKCPNLEILHIIRSELDATCITSLARGCPLLKHLQLDDIRVTEEGLRALADCGPQLREVIFRS